MKIFNTEAQLALAKLTTLDQVVMTKGKVSIGDGGGKKFIIKAAGASGITLANGNVAVDYGDVNKSNISTYTDLVYKASGGNSAVENMIAGIPKAAGVGDICSTGSTTWKLISGDGSSLDHYQAISDVTFTDFVTVLDGSVDVSSKFQTLVDYSFARGLALFTGCGKFRFDSAINLPSTVHIYGNNGRTDPFSDVTARATEFICESEKMFTRASGGVFGSIRGIFFRGSYSVPDDGIFMDAWFLGEVSDCTIATFGVVFNKEISNGVIERNKITSVRKIAFNGRLTDSVACNNYINGASGDGKNATCFSEISTTRVYGNYIDFFKLIFGKSLDGTLFGATYSTITDNIIERSFRVFNYPSLSEIGRINHSTISNNVIRYLDIATTKALFTAPDTDMNTLEWGFLFAFGATRSSITSNTITNCDRSFYFTGYPYYELTVTGNRYGNNVLNKMYYVTGIAGGIPNEQTQIYIDELDNQEYTVGNLPNPNLTSNVTTFDKIRAFEANRLVTNIGGTWYYSDGTSV